MLLRFLKITTPLFWFSLIIIVLVIAGFFFYPFVSQAKNLSSYRPGELLVKFKDRSEIDKVLIDSSQSLETIIATYADNPAIEYLEPNFLITATAFPNDTHYFQQPHLVAINARDAWSKELLTRQEENITRQSVIAILDTGVDLDHPDLKDRIWINTDEVANDNSDNDNNGFRDDRNGWDFVENDNDSNPTFNPGFISDAVHHGTLVAGIAAAASNNNQGITGVSWFSQIMPLRVLDSDGSGDAFNVVRAIDYAIANGADVINMSFVGANFSQSLFDAVQRAHQQGVVVVAAAGNTDSKANGVNLNIEPSYPVCFSGSNGANYVVGVASVDSRLKKSPFSNYGNCIDIVAPGERFFSTQVWDPTAPGFEAQYNGFWSGTSLSAPLVSGTFGLLKSLRPQLSVTDLQTIVFQAARNIDGQNPEFSGQLGSGQLDVATAVERLLGQPVPQAPAGTSNLLVAGLGAGSFPQLKILQADGGIFKEFFAYSPFFTGSINVATGDVNGDRKEEIVTGAGFGGGPHVRIFNIEGQVLGQFFAYDPSFRGGVNIAVGDIDNDGQAEIITGSGRGGKPEVKVFTYQGRLLHRFMAYDEKFLGGVNVAVGDLDRDGRIDIVTGAGNGGGPHVRIFQIDGRLIGQFFAFNQLFNGGVHVAVGDIHGDGQPEIVTSVQQNSIPTVRVYTYLGNQILEFFAYDVGFLAGVNIAVGDIDNDGVGEIITGKGVGGDSQLRVFDKTGRQQLELLTHTGSYRGGVRPAILY